MMRADDQVGTLQKGRVANFIITSGNLFGADNVIYENWIRGKQYIVNQKDAADLRGTWNLTLAGLNGGNQTNLKLNITGSRPISPSFRLYLIRLKSLRRWP
jgi:hypothetical protein